MTVRTFLVVADNSAEMGVALRYAAGRAKAVAGRVAILYVIEPDIIQTWSGVAQTLADDDMALAENKLAALATEVRAMGGGEPLLITKHGTRQDALLKTLADHQDISVLVLAAATGSAGPGPLISHLMTARGLSALTVPLIVVPDTYDGKGDL